MNLSLSFFVFPGMICLIAFFLIYLQVVFVIFLMAVPLSHCNTSRNVFTEEDLTPIVENLKWDDKEEQTAMADYFHPKSSDVQKRSNVVSCDCREFAHKRLTESCPDGCIPFWEKDCNKSYCNTCHISFKNWSTCNFRLNQAEIINKR